ncbi:hypothetical protein PS712_04750 [Pseudomonas fluorescens]|jgi:uncharacterized membrane protein|uniref:DUF502 domain-containing protein n=1 Tax=Pseudomonas fluorescens TaxID=294 RepID=A0A5E7ELP3_PSEFL|nr:DUF502 domain-containing protein [Pseudomonas fluorescens]VVO27644.1 hypothetical protein PS712_04750 [Pseudomonas fluorescens]
MKQLLGYFTKRVIAGLLVIIPIYLAILVLLKGMKSLGQLVRPFTNILPDWLPAEQLLSLILVLLICFVIGAALRTRLGQSARERVEKGLFERIPGYGLFRSLTQQVAGDSRQTVWKPALVEIEDALVPAFIIEVFEDGRYTIFVPSVPTPLAGAVYILEASRVHPLDVSFTDAFKVISKWGSGAKDLVAAMESAKPRLDPAVTTHKVDSIP